MAADLVKTKEKNLLVAASLTLGSHAIFVIGILCCTHVAQELLPAKYMRHKLKAMIVYPACRFPDSNILCYEFI